MTASATVVPHPRSDLGAARRVLADHEGYDPAVVLTACEVVIHRGFGREVEDARFLFDAYLSWSVLEVNVEAAEAAVRADLDAAVRRQMRWAGVLLMWIAVGVAAVIFLPSLFGVP